MPHTLVPSDRVESAPVYGRDNKKIGTIERLMIEKKSGTVAYAVIRSGGLIAGDVRHYPVRWDSLNYDAARHAYTSTATVEELRSRSPELDGEDFDWGDRSAVYQHPHYWAV
jgi:PRC-barrel domain